jgi:prepilin-type N-terminal cleavage/methylation domain-containing protein
MSHSSRDARRAFTLVEMVATVTILGIIGAAVLPVIESAGALYAESARAGRTVERASFAADRISRLLREIPINETADGLAITAIEPERLALASGDGLSLDNGQLLITIGGRSATLCADVDAFELMGLGADGVTPTEGTPAATRIIQVRLVVNGLEMRTETFLRSAMGVSP